MSQITPRSLGYRMPAEWEPQDAIWLSWPHNELTWPEGLLADVERAYVEIIVALHPAQKIKLLVRDAEAEANIGGTLKRAGVAPAQVIFFQIPTEDSWIRDYGPTFVVNDRARELAMVKWTFNAWGEKYEDLIADNKIPYEMNRRLGLRMFEPGIVLEGGSIEVNGAGAVLTTEQCLLNKNRNRNLSRQEIESYLKEYLSVSKVFWLNEGIAGDDTDGHIDDIARFVDADTVVCALEEDPADENYKILKDNYERLVSFGLNVIQLPMPGFVGGPEGRLPASYANFYIGTGAVVVPVFGHANDKRALDVIQKCYPNRRVVGVRSTAMVHGLGTIHCCSQQEPGGNSGTDEI
ncbi:MAG TPA: agmatine deiminase family protein [Terriglobia bacterium]|nr:agmatine deiminase family protein [Terriglobia bacterium]